MGTIEDNEFIAYQIEQEIICEKCIDEDEIHSVSEEQIITEKRLENTEEFLFCDRCTERIWPI